MLSDHDLAEAARRCRLLGGARHQQALGELARVLTNHVRDCTDLAMDPTADLAHLLFRFQIEVRRDERQSG